MSGVPIRASQGAEGLAAGLHLGQGQGSRKTPGRSAFRLGLRLQIHEFQDRGGSDTQLWGFGVRAGALGQETHESHLPFLRPLSCSTTLFQARREALGPGEHRLTRHREWPPII